MSGSYVYAVGHFSDSLVVVDVSNPASPVIRGSVVSSSLLDGVRMTQSRVRPVRHARVRGATACFFSVALSLVRSHVLCTQACGVAVRSSYAYVTAYNIHALVVVDVSNPASPSIRGSVVSSSLMNIPVCVAVSGSYAYVTAANSLVAVDVSNPASPVIRGSVVSSSLLDGVRV